MSIRARRSTGPVVAVTGAATGAGRALAIRLAQSGQIRKVVALDDHRGDVPGVTWRVVDVRDPLLSGRLADVDVIVHLDVERSPEADPRERRTRNVRGAQTVLTAAGAARVRHVVLVTSAAVYGASPENTVPLPEDAPLRAERNASLIGDFLEIEDLAQIAPLSHPGMKVTAVRPAALVGPGMDTIVSRHFESPRLLGVRGSSPRWQFCHVDDLVSALELVVLGKVSGAAGEAPYDRFSAVAVGSDGWLQQQEVEQITGKRRLELPAAVTFGTAERLYRLGITPAPAAELHYVVYPWVLDCASLRAAGWKPSHDNAAVLTALLEETAGRYAVAGRRLGGKEATMATAAGATAAVIGAAAVVRARRKRRG
ncbi:NAD-dependent epimerase/dehydratase family protein [Actinomadura scrupuli]|uniref:NAD-dependent epimerase/dehydratase family protein n=1 Tax=Actinomadura scrupuli TaxID=559629 RepID=UPI003D9711A5